MSVETFLSIVIIAGLLCVAVIIWGFPLFVRFYGWLFDLLFPTHYEYDDDEYDDDDYEYF